MSLSCVITWKSYQRCTVVESLEAKDNVGSEDLFSCGILAR